jgi:hypothetical protein
MTREVIMASRIGPREVVADIAFADRAQDGIGKPGRRDPQVLRADASRGL